MVRLAKDARDMRSDYDVIVVGSGYGGGVAASRLARAGFSVCLLERGREILPGEFPDSFFEARRELQLHSEGFKLGSSTALFDLRMGDGVHVLSGCGLGGTSLINANVCLTPHDSVFEDEIWPSRLREDHWLNLGFYRARMMLQPAILPERHTPLKYQALDTAAQKNGWKAQHVPLHITFENHVNPAGVRQRACTLCGDCISGCNIGAKTTTYSTYLTDAVNHGADIFVEQTVRFVQKSRGRRKWRLVLAPSHGEGASARTSIVARHSLFADKVVIAAGTLGTAEIMMRSRERGLAVSKMLGKRFSSNADSIAFGYNNDIRINGIGTGRKHIADVPTVGPAVAGMIDMRSGRPVEEQMVIVEASVQSAMAPVMPAALSAGGANGVDMDHGFADALRESGRTLESLVLGAYRGAAANTQTFLVVGHDDSGGQIVFRNDRAIVHWPDAGGAPVFKEIEQTLKSLIGATGGTYIPNPASLKILGSNLMTVHPLGGCVMGEDVSRGVVDHKCRVFDADNDSDATAVHDGLYICDGSVLPRSLGVHPLMTITAVAERAMALAARDERRKILTGDDRKPPLRDFVSRLEVPAQERG